MLTRHLSFGPAVWDSLAAAVYDNGLSLSTLKQKWKRAPTIRRTSSGIAVASVISAMWYKCRDLITYLLTFLLKNLVIGVCESKGAALFSTVAGNFTKFWDSMVNL